MHIGTLVFVFTYVLICMGENSPRKLDRPTAALLGAVLMVMTRSLTRMEALEAVDLSTIALLFGMMVLLSVLTQSRVPTYCSMKALRRCGSVHKLLAGVIFASSIASAFMLNDTVCLLGTPILLEVVSLAGLPATPFLLALATSSNIGSAMTLIGNPQNMIIGHLSGWSWSGFFLRMAPVGLVCLAADWLIIYLLFRKQLASVDMQNVCLPDDEFGIKRKTAVRSLVMFAVFIAAIMLGAPMDFAAVAAATLLLVWINRPPKLTLEMVDWSLLLFFAGLFVVVEGLLRADRTILEHCLGALGAHATFANIIKWSVTTVVGSNIFSNVPFVLIASHWVGQVRDPMLFWLLLSLTSTFAGNLTLFGSVANVIVAQRSQDQSPLSFWDFLRAGVPVTVVTTAIGVTMLWALHLLGWA